MSLVPLRDVVLIELDKELESAGGIQLPESVKDPAGTVTGVIKAINSRYPNPSSEFGYIYMNDVSKGQRVLFARKHGTVVKGEKKMVTVKYENLLAVYEE